MRFLFLLLAFLLLPFAAAAQAPAALESLHVALWPEFDDPRLLVILDGVLSQPGATVRIPIPADAKLNAVATAGANGGFLNAAYQTETIADGQIIVLSPQSPAFRIEYYAPLSTTGDQRQAAFSLPAGYVAAKTVSIETLLPPDAAGLSADPAMQPGGVGSNGGQLFLRQLDGGSEQGFSQQIRYSNPAGALTVSETARAATAPVVAPTPVATRQAASSSRTPLLLGLGLAAIALIAAGVYGIWRTRPPEPPRSTRSTPSAVRTSPDHDRFCRQCGAEFQRSDRFCRQCGAARQ
jgi:hypothetical protein